MGPSECFVGGAEGGWIVEISRSWYKGLLFLATTHTHVVTLDRVPGRLWSDLVVVRDMWRHNPNSLRSFHVDYYYAPDA